VDGVAGMSDHRRPIVAFSRRLAGNNGKKTGGFCRIEIFPAKDFALLWEPSGKGFSPKPPLLDSSRKIFWEGRYRIRVDGRWLVDGAKYTLFTREEILDRFFRF
jgi:hypothetical protein